MTDDVAFDGQNALLATACGSSLLGEAPTACSGKRRRLRAKLQAAGVRGELALLEISLGLPASHSPLDVIAEGVPEQNVVLAESCKSTSGGLPKSGGLSRDADQ